MKRQILFSRKNNQNCISLMSAEFAHRRANDHRNRNLRRDRNILTSRKNGDLELMPAYTLVQYNQGLCFSPKEFSTIMALIFELQRPRKAACAVDMGVPC